MIDDLISFRVMFVILAVILIQELVSNPITCFHQPVKW